MVKEKFFVSQTENNDCAAACLTMILKLNNINVNLDDIKKKLKIDKDGASAYEIIDIAKKYGIKATGYKNMEVENLNSAFIAHVIKDKMQHFVVVLKVFKDKVLIADPARNISYVDKNEFNKIYTKIALVFKKNDNIYQKVFTSNKKIIFKILLLTLLFTFVCICYSYMFSFILSINNSSLKLIFLIFLFIFGLLKDFINYVRVKLSFKLQVLTDKILTISVIRKIIDLPDSYYQKNAVGSLMSKLNDLSYVKDMISKIINNAFINCFLIISLLLFLLFYNPIIMIFNMFLIIIVYILNKRFLKYSLYSSYDLQIKAENLNKYTTECLSLIQLVKSLSKENHFKSKIENTYNDYALEYKKTFNMYNKKNLIITTLFTFYIILLCIYLITKNIPLTNLIFIYNLENIIIDSLSSLLDLTLLYSNFKNAVKRISEIYKYDNDETNQKLIISNIKFNHVYFKYNNKLVLNNFSLNIKNGDFIMINGKSGVGKSTIFKILLKKVKYNGNNILINNQKLKDIDSNLINDNIIYIDQKIKLFNDTIRENIYMGDESDKNVLKITNLNSIILDDEVDNINSNISSGQISKIAICQALLSKKNIIILDEVTTTLDKDEERKILSNIKNNYDKTIIVITHRKSNTDLFNKIITIN